MRCAHNVQLCALGHFENNKVANKWKMYNFISWFKMNYNLFGLLARNQHPFANAPSALATHCKSNCESITVMWVRKTTETDFFCFDCETQSLSSVWLRVINNNEWASIILLTIFYSSQFHIQSDKNVFIKPFGFWNQLWFICRKFFNNLFKFHLHPSTATGKKLRYLLSFYQ